MLDRKQTCVHGLYYDFDYIIATVQRSRDNATTYANEYKITVLHRYFTYDRRFSETKVVYTTYINIDENLRYSLLCDEIPCHRLQTRLADLHFGDDDQSFTQVDIENSTHHKRLGSIATIAFRELDFDNVQDVMSWSAVAVGWESEWFFERFEARLTDLCESGTPLYMSSFVNFPRLVFPFGSYDLDRAMILENPNNLPLNVARWGEWNIAPPEQDFKRRFIDAIEGYFTGSMDAHRANLVRNKTADEWELGYGWVPIFEVIADVREWNTVEAAFENYNMIEELYETEFVDSDYMISNYDIRHVLPFIRGEMSVDDLQAFVDPELMEWE